MSCYGFSFPVYERTLILPFPFEQPSSSSLPHSRTVRSHPLLPPSASTSLISLPPAVILPGVTRDSILSLARSHAEGKNTLEGLPAKFKVTERNLTSE